MCYKHIRLSPHCRRGVLFRESETRSVFQRNPTTPFDYYRVRWAPSGLTIMGSVGIRQVSVVASVVLTERRLRMGLLTVADMGHVKTRGCTHPTSTSSELSLFQHLSIYKAWKSEGSWAHLSHHGQCGGEGACISTRRGTMFWKIATKAKSSLHDLHGHNN